MKGRGKLFTSVLTCMVPALLVAGSTFRVSTDTLGGDTNNSSGFPTISGNGRFVVFGSDASNIVPFDTNGMTDVFVYDRILGMTERVSISTNGLQGNDHSGYPSISYDGRYVSFASSSVAHVQGDTNGVSDIFVHDRLTKETSRVSISTSGQQANATSNTACISPDGRVIAFASYATNLVPGDTNGQSDVFIHDLATGQTSLVSVSGEEAPSNSFSWVTRFCLSYDGRHIAFLSHATNLVPGDTNDRPDIFVRDVVAGTTTRVSVSSSGLQSNQDSENPTISYDGRFVAFESLADNLIINDTNGGRDVFLRDIQANTTIRVSVANGGIESNWAADSFRPSIDSSGRFIAFDTQATNFSPQDPDSNSDIYIHDRISLTTTLCSANTLGQGGNGSSEYASLSASGLQVSFDSTASNLVPLDGNSKRDVFFHDTTSQLLLPSDWQRIRGVEVSGSINSLLSSDEDKLVLRPGPVLSSLQAPIEIVVRTSTAISSPTRIELFVESSGSSSSVIQTLALLDYSTNSKVVLGSNAVTIGDRTISQFVIDNPQRFLNVAGQVQATLTWKASGPTLSYPWQVRIDHIYWAVSP